MFLLVSFYVSWPQFIFVQNHDSCFFFLIWNCLAYLCPLFYCFRLHFLYTACCVTFFANCDGLHVVKSASILAKFSAKHFHISLFMVMGKSLPIRGTCINLKDQNEREDIIHLRLFQPDIVALKKFLSTSKNYQFLHYRLRYLEGNSQIPKNCSSSQFCFVVFLIYFFID